jgi:hypothetical protein
MNHIETFYRLIGKIADKGEITLEQYNELLELNPQTDDDVHAGYDVLFQQVKDNKIWDIYKRLIKGAEMIEAETDDSKIRYYNKVYDKLLDQLEQLRTGGTV